LYLSPKQDLRRDKLTLQTRKTPTPGIIRNYKRKQTGSMHKAWFKHGLKERTERTEIGAKTRNEY
jgi:hypothetical protein